MTQRSKESKIRLLIADDHEMVRIGLRTMLADTNIEVVAEVATGEAAVNYVSQHPVDVVLLDLRMPDGDGLSALARMKLAKPELPVVILSNYDNPSFIARAVALGANAFLLKDCSREKLIDTIQRAAKKESLWTREELRRITGALAAPRPASDIDVPLTEREFLVLRHVANGLTNKEIAEAMKISYETVKEHVQHILRKLGVSDRTQAAVWAVRKNLV
ncbi:MAG: response regulator transcription factor [Thermoguttaceae bacterium]|nr:response regulator transcription factor [Thermoguttaceae bacterium]MDW8078788.1 response regulator transcription factor [Thermoguttaceae bacterium]